MGTMVIFPPKIAHMISLVSDGITLKEPTRSGNPQRKVTVRNYFSKFGTIIFILPYYALGLDVGWS